MENTSFAPSGLWELQANTPTTLKAIQWRCNSTSDENTNSMLGALVMKGPSSDLSTPSASKYKVSLYINRADFAYTGEMKVDIVYVPTSIESQDLSYIMETITVNDEQPEVFITQTLFAQENDIIRLQVTTSTPLSTNVDSLSARSFLTLEDISQQVEPFYYVGVDGTPMKSAQVAAVNVMLSAPIINNRATFHLTQSGQVNGQSQFQTKIAYSSITVQANSQDTNLVPPSDPYLLAYPLDFKSITVVFSKAGSPNVTWYANAVITGA